MGDCMVTKDGEYRSTVRFIAAAWLPNLVYRACVATGIPSNTAYMRNAVCEALARDLGLDLQSLLDAQPVPRTASKQLRVSIREHQSGGVARIGPTNSVEEVR